MTERADGGGGVRRVAVFVRGDVQGVGFRWWTRSRALELGLAGFARNTADGRVEVVAEGPEDALTRLVALLAEQPSSARRPGRVDTVSTPAWGDARGQQGFRER
ncbi:acylphosphatase [Oryzobacter telluris]|jgi:acylphosphatase|uniref:acylphosphatase n=1 Tax=Oryzobacter telluris TaxID=3149179 RepID=UPI00370D5F36